MISRSTMSKQMKGNKMPIKITPIKKNKVDVGLQQALRKKKPVSKMPVPEKRPASVSKNKVNNSGIATLKKQISGFDKFENLSGARLKRVKSLKSRLKSLETQKRGITADPRVTKNVRSDKNQKGPIKKGPIVTKKQLKDSGFTNLRDYLNDKQGKTRKKDAVLVKGTVGSNYKTNNKQRNMGIVKKSYGGSMKKGK